MRNFITLIIAVILVSLFTSTLAFAEGDKVRGDNGDGSVCQYQNVVNGDPAYEGDGCE